MLSAFPPPPIVPLGFSSVVLSFFLLETPLTEPVGFGEKGMFSILFSPWSWSTFPPVVLVLIHPTLDRLTF